MPRDVARLCLLLSNYVDDIEVLLEEERLCEAWREMGIRLQAATDQHAAMTEELERLTGVVWGHGGPDAVPRNFVLYCADMGWLEIVK